jgi:glycosyltransferase involved in cell wall biosynthesis
VNVIQQGDVEATPSVPASIALVGPLPPPSGGMANQTMQLARLLEEEGCRVTLVQTNRPYRPSWIARFRGVRALFRLAPYLRSLWRAMDDGDLVHVMANSGWAWHFFGAPAIWIGWLRGRPVVVNYRGGAAQAFLDRQWILVRPTLQRAACLIVPSRFLERVFEARKMRVQIVPNIVDLARFHPSDRVERGWHVVVARNLEDIYDIPTALRAFAVVHRRHPHARLTVVGSGPALIMLERLADELALRGAVTFTGRLDNARMADVYRSADLALNPSRVDNMPISLLEAMASGVPTVSTNAGGIPDMVDDGKTALLVPVGDWQAMAEAALRVLENAQLASSLRAAGIEAAQRYTWKAVRPLFNRVYARAGSSSFVQTRSKEVAKHERQCL